MDAISQTPFSNIFSSIIKISLKFVPKGPINNIPALVQIMAWRRPGDKPLSEPMMVRSTTHICITQPQCVNYVWVKGVIGINSWWPSKTLWQRRSESSWAQVMACWLMAPSPFLIQYWLINGIVAEINFTRSVQDINLQFEFEKCTNEITSPSLRGEGLKCNLLNHTCMFSNLPIQVIILLARRLSQRK